MDNKKIVVVEDDDYVLELISYTLKKTDFTVITASDGVQGLEAALLAGHARPGMIEPCRPFLDGPGF